MDVTVIGLGRVGTVIAASLANDGYLVLGLDTDPSRVGEIKYGRVPFFEPELQPMLTPALSRGLFWSLHPDNLKRPLMGIVIIAVGTPPQPSGVVNLDQVYSALDFVKHHAEPDTIVVMKSTIPPGTGECIAKDLREAGLHYVANPEFLREGHAIQDWRYPDRVVIGSSDDDAGFEVRRLYADIPVERIIYTDITSAEMIKYASNAFLATRISFINSMASICDMVGASIDDVSNGISFDHRTGTKMYAGLGFGGSCLQKDMRALENLAIDNHVDTRLLQSVIKINDQQRSLPLCALRKRFGGLADVRVAVLGLAFKPGTDDVQSSPATRVVGMMAAEGAVVSVYDTQAMDNARSYFDQSSSLYVRFAESMSDALTDAQAVVLATEWDEFVQADWGSLSNIMAPPRFIFDGRNALDANTMQSLGFEYVGVGRGRQPGSTL